MGSPKVTVILCTYNRPYYLGEAIESVIRQDFTDWELLLINDGGIDVGDIAARYKDPRIRYFNNKANVGKAACCNQGLAEASGRYIAYIDDDDKWYPNHLAVLSRELDNLPELGAVYSDMNSVIYAFDNNTRQRVPLQKQVLVSRDFNPVTIYEVNPILHISLMHTKEAALRVGGYNEQVAVFIDWSIVRKLAFLYQIRHVNKLTGEYMVSSSDMVNLNRKESDNKPLFNKITQDERSDPNRLREKVQAILADTPPLPWPEKDSIEIIVPVIRWDKKTIERVITLFEKMQYPAWAAIYNNGLDLSEEQFRKDLGFFGYYRRLRFIHSRQRKDLSLAFQEAARSSDADYILLATQRLKAEAVPYRLYSGLFFLKESSKNAVKWNVNDEVDSPYDVLINRETFLNNGWSNSKSEFRLISKSDFGAVDLLKTDKMKDDMLAFLENGAYDRAADIAFDIVTKPGPGAPRPQYTAAYFVHAARKTGDYDRAIEVCEQLIHQGYGHRNYYLLGLLLMEKGAYSLASHAFSTCLNQIGFKPEDLSSDIFPCKLSVEPDAFNCIMGIGDCFIEMAKPDEAERMFAAAARLLADSHRPLLGMAKLFLAKGRVDLAENAVQRLAGLDGKDNPEVHAVLADICLRKGEDDLAFKCLYKAWELDPGNVIRLEAMFDLGKKLERWPVLEKALLTFMAKNPGNTSAMERLKEVQARFGIRSGSTQISADAAAHFSRPGRNQPCPCGSGKKYKKCCFDKDPAPEGIMQIHS